MDQAGFRQWIRSISQNIAASICYALLCGAGVATLARFGSTWMFPFIYGLLTALLVLVILLATKAIRRLPPIAERVSNDNVEEKVRAWLDRTNLTVKKDPNPQTYFRYLVTTDGGRKVLVGRAKGETSDYLQFRAEIVTSDEEKKELAKFDDEEKVRLVLDIQLELARARIGYAGLSSANDGFAIHKKIPIAHSLDEDQVIRAIWEMEAVLNQVFATGAIAFHRHRTKKGGMETRAEETQLIRVETGPETF